MIASRRRRAGLVVAAVFAAAAFGAGWIAEVGTASHLTAASRLPVTESPTPTPTTGFKSASGACPPSVYPNPSCVGFRAGTVVVRTVEGDYTADAPGQVIAGWHITGNLIVTAPQVVIRDSQIDGIVTDGDAEGASFTITDSTIGPKSGCHFDRTYYNVGLNGHDITALRVFARNDEDGLDLSGGNVHIADSLFVQCFLGASVVGGDGYHSDGVQDLCDAVCSNLTLTHNTFDSRDGGNSALNLGSEADGLKLRAVTLSDNLFLGGGYTTYLQWDGGPPWTVTNNHWVDKTWEYDALETQGTCSHQNWSGNNIVTIDSSYRIASTIGALTCA